MSMDGSTYDDTEEINFILCNVCNVKIRGETLYKIHLTENQHLKKEDALVACGKIRRETPLPKWTSLYQYLDYLQLDEPIIGLQHLVEVHSDGTGPRYLCRLCYIQADLPGITNHVLGRKHRQKYLVANRPDLVTWDINNVAQLGKLVRAKAEVVERQDGRGVPEERKRKTREVKPHLGTFRVTLKEGPDVTGSQTRYNKSNQGPPQIQSTSGFSRGQLRRKEMAGYRQEYPEMDGYGQQYGRTYHEEDHDEQRYQGEVPYDEGHLGEDPYRNQYQEGEHYGQSYAERCPHWQDRLDEESCVEDSRQEAPFSPKDEWGVHRGDAGRGERRYTNLSEEERKRERLVRLLHNCAQGSLHNAPPAGRTGARGNRTDRSEGPSYGFGYSRGSETMPFEKKAGRNPAQYDQGDRMRNTESDRRERLSYHGDFHYGDDDRLSTECDDPPRKRVRTDPNSQQQVDWRRPEPKTTYSNVLDALKSIEIETMDEANFIKDKLCNLLEEFQANKSEKAKINSKTLSSQSQPKKTSAFSEDFDNMNSEEGFQPEEYGGQREWQEPHGDAYRDDPRDHYRSQDRYRGRRNSHDRYRGGSCTSMERFESFDGNLEDSNCRDHLSDSRSYYGEPSRSFQDHHDRYADGVEEQLADRRRSDSHIDSAASRQDYNKGDLRRGDRSSRERQPNRLPHSRSEAPSEDAWSSFERPERPTFPHTYSPRRRGSLRRADPPFHNRPEYVSRREQDLATEPPSSSSLNKITSTLLQLVARKGSF